MAKYLDGTGLSKAFELIKNWVTTNFLSDVSYNSTSKKIQKTKNGTTSDVVALATVATSGSYNDLDDKPTIPPTYTLPDANATTKGGVKLSDATNGTQTAASGVTAATPKAVADALAAALAADTTYNDFTGAAASAAGAHGLVPAPYSGEQSSFLLGDGEWHPPTDLDIECVELMYNTQDYRPYMKLFVNGVAGGAMSADFPLARYVSTGSQIGYHRGLMTGEQAEKLAGIAAGAEVNVQSDWNQTNTSADDYIKNKPTLPTIPNGFANVKVGSTTIEADSETDTLELVAGSGISLTPDATNDKVTVSSDNVALYLYRDTTNNRDEIRLRQGDTLRGAITYSGDSYISITSDGSAAPESIALSLNDLPASKITSGTFSTNRIPGLDAAKIISGTLGTSRIPNLDASKITSGTFNAARIPNLDASKITSGTIDEARLPSSVVGGLQYQGTAANASAISGTSYKKGWYWIASATFALTSGINVEPGDMIIAKQNKTSTFANDIDVVQTNIDTLTDAEVTALWNAA